MQWSATVFLCSRCNGCSAQLPNRGLGWGTCGGSGLAVTVGLAVGAAPRAVLHGCLLQYKDARRGKVGVEGFGRLLDDAGRLVSRDQLGGGGGGGVLEGWVGGWGGGWGGVWACLSCAEGLPIFHPQPSALPRHASQVQPPASSKAY